MINEDEAQKLVIEYKTLKNNYKNNKTNENLITLQKHEKICIDKLDYLVKMRTARYKQFNNHEDLYQEGLLALFRAMSNYESNKGSFFWWAHKYIATKVKRSANLHTTIRYPLKEANKYTPHKEFVMPLLIEETYCPDKLVESAEIRDLIRNSLNCLTKNQKIVISLVYGIDVESPYPINKICRSLGMSRVTCKKIIKSAMSKIKNNINQDKRIING